MAENSPQKRVPLLAYLWPGLPHLWMEGSWAGLLLAIGFTALANLALVNWLVWPELLEPRAKWVGSVALFVLWLAALVETRGELRRQAARRQAAAENRPDPEDVSRQERQAEADRQLRMAQRQYLAGDWVEAERTLTLLLESQAEDVEAQLLLATLWKHLQRPWEAQRHLHRLLRLESAAAWRFEIERELEQLSETVLANSDNPSNANDRSSELEGDSSAVTVSEPERDLELETEVIEVTETEEWSIRLPFPTASQQPNESIKRAA